MIQPGFYSWAYPSYMVSPYYCWFVLMGWPQLDINVLDDGAWEIIQYYRSPVIPAQTEWQMVLGTMENVEISYTFCEKVVKQLDLHRKQFWDREEAKSKAVADEFEKKERHAEEYAEMASKAILGNEGLMNRIAKYGMQEMDLDRIARHIHKDEFSRPIFKGKKIKGDLDVPNPGKPVQ